MSGISARFPFSLFVIGLLNEDRPMLFVLGSESYVKQIKLKE